MNEPAERALRAIQKYDELSEAGNRYLLMDALDALGEILGLACTGVKEMDGFYSHDGDTCPIHEWLREEDAAAVNREVVPRLRPV